MKGRAVIAGALAQKRASGGHTWVFLNWLLGLRRLGWDVLFLDSHGPDMFASAREEVANLDYVSSVMKIFGLDRCWSVLDRKTGIAVAGLDRDEVSHRMRDADLLLNFSGYLQDEELLDAVALRVFVDIDPGFWQMWCDLGLHDAFGRHDRFVTLGLRIGQATCIVPSCGREWIPTFQPVALDHWPVRRSSRDAITSVGSWRGPFAPIEYRGKSYGLRVHEFRKFADLPGRTGQAFELGLDISAGDARDIELLSAAGWRLVDPKLVAGDPLSYRDYLAASRAELMVAKNMYVETQSGWFSDRSACYLASGKPVVAQDTGLAGVLPAGDGLLLFKTPGDAAGCIESMVGNYPHHARAAREIAETVFDSDRVLTALIDRIYARVPAVRA